MNDVQMRWAFWIGVFVIAICIAWDVLFMAIIEARLEDKIFELQAEVNGLKGLLGVP